MPLPYKYVNQDHVKKMLQRVRRLGYTDEVDIWYDLDGCSGHSLPHRPFAIHPDEALARWQIRKIHASDEGSQGWFYLTMRVDSDGGEQYATFDLWFVYRGNQTMLKNHRLRGAYPKFIIEDITEAELKKLPSFEHLLLLQAEHMAKLVKESKLCNRT